MNSLQVCVGMTESGLLIICPDLDSGEFGPVKDYLFTDNHLLIKTIGASPNEHDPERFSPDPDRLHYFIVDKYFQNPYDLEPLGPLSAEEFYANPAVPGDPQWVRSSNSNFLGPLLGALLILSLALVIYGWPVLLLLACVAIFLIARRLLRSRAGVNATRSDTA